MKHSVIDYWQSYADVTLACMLVLLLIVAAALMNLNESEKKADKAAQAAQSDLDEAYRTTQAALDEAGQAKANLIAVQNAYIALEEQYGLISKQIEQIVGVKADILKALSDELADVGIEVSIDENTGTLLLKEKAFFKTGKSNLLSKGKKTLDTVMPSYIGVLLNEKYLPYVAEIRIEGNADSRGGHEENMTLSTERACSVADYTLEIMRKEQKAGHLSEAQYERLEEILVVSGRGDFNLVYENGKEDLTASRRVELQFRLNDEESIRAIEEYLKGGAQ